jgi:chromosomal replication initiation ATPase DnaA
VTPALEELVRRVALAFNVEKSKVLQAGRLQRKTGSAARRVAMWLAYTTWVPKPSHPEVAEMFGAAHHTTSMDACKYVEQQIAEQTDVGRIAQELARPASTPPPRLRVA